MGRPKGSKNKEKVPTATGTVETNHNINRPGELTDDQKQALFWQHKKLYEKALAAKKLADAELKNAAKLIKAEGSVLDEIKMAAMDPAAFEVHAKSKAESLIRVARYIGSPIGTQFALFDGPDRTSAEEKAFADGKRAGLAGEDASPPYAKHLPQAQNWMTGWHEGQAVLAKGFKPAPDDDDFDDVGEQAAIPAAAELPPVAAAALDEMASEH